MRNEKKNKEIKKVKVNRRHGYRHRRLRLKFYFLWTETRIGEERYGGRDGREVLSRIVKFISESLYSLKGVSKLSTMCRHFLFEFFGKSLSRGLQIKVNENRGLWNCLWSTGDKKFI